MVSSKVIQDIFSFLKNNQANGNGDQMNYVSNIRKKLGYSRRTVWSGLKALENMDLIERRRSGKRKIIRLRSFSGGGFFDDEDRSDDGGYSWV